MKLPTLLTSVLLLLIAFSGCFADEAAPHDDHEGDEEGEDHEEGENETESSTNAPPVAEVVVAANGTSLVPENGSYLVAVGLNVTFDASGSSDPEGGNLTFAWDFGDGNTSTEATSVYAYSAPGNYSVTLTVSDEDGLTNSTSLAFVVAEGGSSNTIYFFDDADTPAAWTFARHILIDPNFSGIGRTVVTQNHPLAVAWHASSKDKLSGTKSWTSQDEAAGGYHDNEYNHMTSPAISLADATVAFLSFSFKGDAEANSLDGVWWELSVDGGAFTRLGGLSGAQHTWKAVVVDLSAHAGKSIQIRFLFQSDISCSDDTPLPEGCGPGTYTGYFVDDIMVSSVAPEIPEEE